MAVEKIGLYRKWLESVPKDNDGKPIPKSQWPKKRRHNWIVRWAFWLKTETTGTKMTLLANFWRCRRRKT